jgi:hypothetical protein
VILTKPVIATVGLSMSIPFSIAFDFTLGKHLSSFGIQYLVGSFMVVLGFFLVNVTYYFPDDLQYFDALQCFKCYKKKEKKVLEIN